MVACAVLPLLSPGLALAYAATLDFSPPLILGVSATPDVLWAPNHTMVDVQVAVSAVDANDPLLWARITGVTIEGQVDNGRGDGNTRGDWVITTDLTLRLRAERSGSANGDRLYCIHVAVTDSSGNTSYTTVVVRVPHSMGNGTT